MLSQRRIAHHLQPPLLALLDHEAKLPRRGDRHARVIIERHLDLLALSVSRSLDVTRPEQARELQEKRLLTDFQAWADPTAVAKCGESFQGGIRR